MTKLINRISFFLLFGTSLMLKAQDVPTEKLRQHSAGLSVGTYINNFTKSKPFRFQEYLVCGFYKYNRFSVSIGLAIMNNPSKTINEPEYILGPNVGLSGDIISYKRIRIPLSLYLNYYRYKYDLPGASYSSQWQNRGCKIGIDYTPFKIPLSIYLYGGVNFSLREGKITNPQGDVHTTNNSKSFAVIDFGLKYSIVNIRSN
jgi:hypothetical protein